MQTVSLKAHYDGERIVLDEPFDLPPDAPLIVTVLPQQPGGETGEREQWADVSAHTLALAYADNEPEYTAADVRVP